MYYNEERLLLYLLGSYAYSFAYFGQGSGPIVMDNLQCTGGENALTDCPYDPDISDCTHFEDSGVMCLPSPSKRMIVMITIFFVFLSLTFYRRV